MNNGPLAIIFASFLWSFDGLLRRSLYVLPPLVVIFYEHLIGFVILFPFILGHLKGIRLIRPRTWGALGWVTILASIIGTLCYTAALGKIQYIQFSVVVLLQQLQPFFVILFAWIVLKEAPPKHYALLMILAVFGAYLLSFPSLTVNVTTGYDSIFAALLAILAAFAWGSSTAFSRYTLLQMPSQLATGLRFALAAIVSGILILLTGHPSAFFAINESQLLVLILIAVTTGMVAMAIYYTGLKKTPAWISAVCELTWPLSAVLIDYGVFHKTLTITQWIGSAMLLLSIYVVSREAKSIPETELID